MKSNKNKHGYLDRTYSEADTDLGRCIAVASVASALRLCGRYVTRDDVVDALTERGVQLFSDIVDQILDYANNK